MSRSEWQANDAMGTAHRRYDKPAQVRKADNVWMVSALVVLFVLGACAVCGWLLAGGGRAIINALGV